MRPSDEHGLDALHFVPAHQPSLALAYRRELRLGKPCEGGPPSTLRALTTIAHAAVARAGAQEAEHGAEEHVIEQVGGALGHPAAAAAWTHRPRFARERYQPVEAAVAAAKPREPAGERATPQKVPELLLDEPRQAFSVAQTRGLRAEGLEVIAHDLVERGLRGTPRFVGRRGRGHSKPKSGRRASDRSEESGQNREGDDAEVAVSARLPAGEDRHSCND